MNTEKGRINYLKRVLKRLAKQRNQCDHMDKKYRKLSRKIDVVREELDSLIEKFA